ncbi:MAG: hypothetical protein HY902_06920, partial [Deltaproteobacteria bacterium]|nr:hypothetical protein [Deltaproteobacteria bacterium]
MRRQGGHLRRRQTQNVGVANSCTADWSDPSAGCRTLALPIPCDDGSVCTTTDLCKNATCAGTAIVCDDNNPCTTDTCDPIKGCGAKTAPDGTPCGEGGVCTAGTCSLGTSLNPAPSCLAILTAAPKSASGLYWLDLDGSG